MIKSKKFSLTDGNKHEGSWDPEGRGVAGVLSGAGDLLPEDRGQDGADQAAAVDGGVEQREVGPHVVLENWNFLL